MTSDFGAAAGNMTDASAYKDLMWSSGAFLVREQPFTLKSGRQSYVYANHRDLICVPDHLRLLAGLLCETAKREAKPPFALCTVDSSVSPFLVAACAVQAATPYYNYRAVSREKGLSDQLFRYDRVPTVGIQPGLPALLVDDVVTTMGTLTTAHRSLEEHEVEVLGAICLLDRRVASDSKPEEFPVIAATTLSDMLTHGLEHGELTDEQRRVIDVEFAALEN